jgi:hypothetical protein
VRRCPRRPWDTAFDASDPRRSAGCEVLRLGWVIGPTGGDHRVQHQLWLTFTTSAGAESKVGRLPVGILDKDMRTNIGGQ